MTYQEKIDVTYNGTLLVDNLLLTQIQLSERASFKNGFNLVKEEEQYDFR